MRDGEMEIRHAQGKLIGDPPVLDWEVKLTADGVELRASLDDPHGDCLVIPMTSRVAAALHQRLGDSIRTGDRVRGTDVSKGAPREDDQARA